jgi:hypothetical protein
MQISCFFLPCASARFADTATDNFRRSIGLHFLYIFPTFTNNFAIFMHGCNIIMCLSTSNTILHYILSLKPHLSFFLEPSLAAKDTCLQRTLWGSPMGCPLQTGFTVHVFVEAFQGDHRVNSAVIWIHIVNICVCSVTCVDFTDDSSMLAVGLQDSDVRVWSLTNNKLRCMKSTQDLELIDKDAGKADYILMISRLYSCVFHSFYLFVCLFCLLLFFRLGLVDWCTCSLVWIPALVNVWPFYLLYICGNLLWSVSIILPVVPILLRMSVTTKSTNLLFDAMWYEIDRKQCLWHIMWLPCSFYCSFLMSQCYCEMVFVYRWCVGTDDGWQNWHRI